MEESPYPCITHFDGKTLFEMNHGKRLESERLACACENLGSHIFLEYLPCNLRQVRMSLGIMKILEEYDIV